MVWLCYICITYWFVQGMDVTWYEAPGGCVHCVVPDAAVHGGHLPQLEFGNLAMCHVFIWHWIDKIYQNHYNAKCYFSWSLRAEQRQRDFTGPTVKECLLCVLQRQRIQSRLWQTESVWREAEHVRKSTIDHIMYA